MDDTLVVQIEQALQDLVHVEGGERLWELAEQDGSQAGSGSMHTFLQMA